MSKNEWERGELTLPRAAIVPIRRAIIARNNAIADEALALSKKVWKEATAAEKRGGFALLDKVLALGGTTKYGYSGAEKVGNDVTERALDILNYSVHRPARPPQKQNAGHLGATATAFRVSSASVSFDTATGVMSWNVDENNRAVDRAHESWLGQTLFNEIKRVKWTRGTGGWFTGNDEYNRESDNFGSGANYVTTAFGPVGAENHPSRTEEFTKSDGTRVTRAALSELQSKVWAREARDQARFARAMSGSSRGKTSAASTAGSFAPRHNSAPSGYLR